jgi:hypothetical protein
MRSSTVFLHTSINDNANASSLSASLLALINHLARSIQTDIDALNLAIIQIPNFSSDTVAA